MKTQYILFFVLIFTQFQIGESKKTILGTFHKKESITLVRPMELYSPYVIGDTIVAYDRLMHEIVLFKKNGTIAWSYAKKGKGPGELSEAVTIAYKNGILYAADNQQNKILSFSYDTKNTVFNYIDEFPVNDGRISEITVLDNGLLYVPILFGDYQAIILDQNGNVVDKMFPSKRVDPQTMNREEIMREIRNNVIVVTGNDRSLLKAGTMSLKLEFFQKNNDQVIPVNTTHCVLKKKETYSTHQENDTDGHKKLNVTVQGITSVFFDGRNYYIMVMPDVSALESLIEVYSIDGNFKGFLCVEKEKNIQVGALRFSDKNTIAFQQWIRNASGDFMTDTTTVYIATRD